MTRRKVKPIYRQFVIEVRCTLATRAQNLAMREAMRQAARVIYGTALLASITFPDVALFTEDYFAGRQPLTKGKGRPCKSAK